MKRYKSLRFLIAAIVMAGAGLICLLLFVTYLIRFLFSLIRLLFKKPADAVSSTV